MDWLKWLRRILRIITLLLALLGIALGGSTTPAHGAELTHDLKAFCTSSLDPKCQPGNLPILIEAGVVNIGTTTTVATAGTGVAGTLTTSAAGATAGLGAAKLGSLGALIVGGSLLTGVEGLQFLTTSGFFAVAGDGATTAPMCAAGGVDCFQVVGSTTYSGMNLHCFKIPVGYTSSVSFLTVNYGTHPAAGMIAGFPGFAYAGPSLCTAPGSSTSNYSGLFVYAGDTVTSFLDTRTGTTYALTEASGDSITGDVKITITCKTGPDASYTREKTEAVEVSAGEPLPVPDLDCNTGGVVSGVQVDWRPTGGSWVTITNPLSVPGAMLELVDLYPECFGPDGSACRVTLWHQSGGERTSCGDRGQYCPDWAKDPVAADHYVCRYGSHDVDLAMCSMFRDPKVGILPNYTEEGEEPGWIPITAPVPPNLQQPTDAAGSPAVLPGPDEDGSNCWSENWGLFNPLSWVYTPIVCAAQFLFVPSDEVLLESQLTSATAWSGTSVAQGMEIVAPLASLPGFTGCDGVPVDIDFTWPFVWGIHWVFGYACDGALAPVAALVSTVIGIGVALAGIYLISSYLGGTIAFRGFNNRSVQGD